MIEYRLSDPSHAHTPRQRTLCGVATSRTLRGHWALHELALDYTCEPVHARTDNMNAPEFLALNPRRKIPVLCDDGVTVCESAAIVTYLAERYGCNTTLAYPSNAVERARYHEWMSFICMELDATSLYVVRRHEYLADIYGHAPIATTSARVYFERMINAAVDVLASEPPYLMGEIFTGVGILMTTCLLWAQRYELSLPTEMMAYCVRTTSRPAYAQATLANASD